MARRRYLSTKISTDTRVNRLAMESGDFAALLYTWLIPHAADDRTLTGDPEELMLQVCPGRRDKSPEDIAAALNAMVTLGLIVWDRGSATIEIAADDWHRWLGPSDISQRIRDITTAQWRRLRIAVFERDDYRCQYCGIVAASPECDHVIPISRGGTNEMSNLATACRKCNRSKQAKLITEWVH